MSNQGVTLNAVRAGPPPAAYAAGNTAHGPRAELINVTTRFGDVVALNDVSIQARPGEVLAVLGPNGAGKTTAISTMLGLMQPTEGTARLFGGSNRQAGARMRVGAMLQISGVPETLTVREHLTSFASYYPAPMQVGQAVELANLSEVADRQYGKLSGGQKQRLHFALAMIGNPDLLFLDEPTTGLDVASRREFWTEIRGFLEGQRTVVLTTHYLEEADALADRMVLIDKGRIVAEGTPAEIKRRAAARRVRAVTRLSLEQVRALPGVAQAQRIGAATNVLTSEAEGVVRQLLQLDESLSDLEVTGAGLEEAFLALTEDPRNAPRNDPRNQRPHDERNDGRADKSRGQEARR